MPRITYFLRPNKDAKQSYVLYCRVTFNGTKTEFSLKEKLDPGKWDQPNQTLRSRGAQKKYIDLLLEANSYKIKSAALFGDQMTARELIDSLSRESEKLPMLDSIVRNYFEGSKQRVSGSTLITNEVRVKNLEAFENYSGRIYNTQSFNLATAQQFLDWFCSRSGTKNVHTASRNIAYYKAAQMEALRKGQIKSFGLIHYQTLRDPSKGVKFLSQEQVHTLRDQRFFSETLTRVRDLFLFQCHTGLSYVDLMKDFEIQGTESGNVIVGSRQKTKQSFFIPLSVEASHILLKYDGQVPKYTNASYNRMLKEIAGLCDLNIILTTHVARKTFATLMDSKGWSRESVARMLGHRSMRTTEQYYIGESNERIIQEMKEKVNVA